FPHNFCPNLLPHCLRPLELLADLGAAIVGTVKRHHFPTGIALMVAENHLHFSPDQLAHQVSCKGYGGTFQDQDANLTQMYPLYLVNGAYHQIIQLIIHFGIAGYHNHAPAHPFSSASRSTSCSKKPVTDW